MTSNRLSTNTTTNSQDDTKLLPHAKLMEHVKSLHPKPVPCRGPYLPTTPYRPIKVTKGVQDDDSGTGGGEYQYAELPEDKSTGGKGITTS